MFSAKIKNTKAHQDERLLQFLMGLNDTFVGVRSNVLLSAPLPNIGQAYSLVIQDEKQREIHATPAYPGDSGSFIVANSGERKYPDLKAQKGGNSGYDGKKSNVICAYCKKPGHSVDKCYKIHGFPADFKFTKPRKFQSTSQGSTAFNSSVYNQSEGFTQRDTNAPEVQALSQENITQILQMLQQMKSNQNAGSEGAANLSLSGMPELSTKLMHRYQIKSERRYI